MINVFKKNNKEKDSDQYFKQICAALKELMPDESRKLKITGKTKIETLGIDSIKYINLFISLEEIIGKELEEVVDSIDISTIKTIDDMVTLVQELK